MGNKLKLTVTAMENNWNQSQFDRIKTTRKNGKINRQIEIRERRRERERARKKKQQQINL